MEKLINEVKKNEDLALEIYNNTNEKIIFVYVDHSEKWNFLDRVKGSKILNRYLDIMENRGNNILFKFGY